jgi:hypothetical protein
MSASQEHRKKSDGDQRLPCGGIELPAYLVKVTTKAGLVKPPMVVNFGDEESVRRLLLENGDDGDVIEIKGPPPHAMLVAYGDVPEGSAVFRFDWIWPAEGGTPRPF